MTKNEYIEEFNRKHNNKYNYSLVEYKKTKDKVKIICPHHGIFEQRLDSHKISGCPDCNSIKLTKNEFINRSKNIHGDKYDYSLVEYINMSTPIKIICKKHGIFKKLPNGHLYAKQGCPVCSNKKTTTEIFINKSKEIHGNKYNYSLVDYKNNYTKVELICKEHGSFYISPSHHIYKKQGCGKCVGLYRTTEEFINKSKEIHGNKYNYSLVDYKKSHKKVKIICKKHNKIFEQTPHEHLSGQGCPFCKIQTNEEFIIKSENIHGDKYDYSLIKYIRSNKKVKIICKKHNKIFEQTPANHVIGQGCPKCNDSKGEKKISYFLTNSNVKYIEQYKFDNCKHKYKLPFDFYLPEYNCCIEYDGKQHFEIIKYWGGEENFNKIKIRDKIKNDYCIENNIKLIRIKYNDNINEKINL